MEILISKRRSSYVFEKNGEPIFIAEASGFQKKMISYEKGELISKVGFGFQFPFKLVNRITLPLLGESFILQYQLFSGKHVCKFNDSDYEVRYHKGRKLSVFQNTQQIAYFETKEADLLGNHQIQLLCNDNSQTDILCSFVLAISCDFQNDYSLISWDVGNVAPEKYSFDFNWKPK